MTRQTLKARYLKALFRIAFLRPFRPVLYTRCVSRWPYQQSLEQMMALSRLLLAVDCEGAYLEVGCAEGNTTIWQGMAMLEAGVSRRMCVVDTFSGFTSADIAEELRRGKERGVYDSYFVVNDQEWFDESMRRSGMTVTSFRADCSSFDYRQVGTIAFAMLDVDLYLPVRRTLPLIRASMASGGLIVVDDCDPGTPLWDGAHRAYLEYCHDHNVQPEIVAGKFGLVRT